MNETDYRCPYCDKVNPDHRKEDCPELTRCYYCGKLNPGHEASDCPDFFEEPPDPPTYWDAQQMMGAGIDPTAPDAYRQLDRALDILNGRLP